MYAASPGYVFTGVTARTAIRHVNSSSQFALETRKPASNHVVLSSDIEFTNMQNPDMCHVSLSCFLIEL
jgi:hypothetical protein